MTAEIIATQLVHHGAWVGEGRVISSLRDRQMLRVEKLLPKTRTLITGVVALLVASDDLAIQNDTGHTDGEDVQRISLLAEQGFQENCNRPGDQIDDLGLGAEQTQRGTQLIQFSHFYLQQVFLKSRSSKNSVTYAAA